MYMVCGSSTGTDTTWWTRSRGLFCDDLYNNNIDYLGSPVLSKSYHELTSDANTTVDDPYSCGWFVGDAGIVIAGGSGIQKNGNQGGIFMGQPTRRTVLNGWIYYSSYGGYCYRWWYNGTFYGSTSIIGSPYYHWWNHGNTSSHTGIEYIGGSWGYDIKTGVFCRCFGLATFTDCQCRLSKN